MRAALPRRLSGSPARGPAAGIAGCLDALGALLSFGFGGAAFYGEPGQRPSSHSIKARWLAGALRVAHLALCWRGCLCQAGGTLIPQAGPLSGHASVPMPSCPLEATALICRI